MSNTINTNNNGIRIYIGGPQGVGKTTLIKELSKKYNVPCYTSSQVFMNYLNIDRKALEAVDETNPELITEVFTDFYNKNKNFILDGHFQLANSATPDTFTACIFLYAPFDIILQRKKLDQQRIRHDNNTAQDIGAEMYKKLVRACKFSNKVFILNNNDETKNSLVNLEKIVFMSKMLPQEDAGKLIFAQDLLDNFLAPNIDFIKEYSLGQKAIANNRNNKYESKPQLNAFVKGSFDCVHMGHFLMLCDAKMIASWKLNRKYHDTKLTAVLSQQDGGKHKGVEYLQPQSERENAVLGTGVVNKTDFCDDTKLFVLQNANDIDLFIFGADQNNSYFKGVEDICKRLHIKTANLSSRYADISSTKIREKSIYNNMSYQEAKSYVEQNTPISTENRKKLKYLKCKAAINKENLDNFNIIL